MDVEIELVSNCRAIDLFQQNLTNAFKFQDKWKLSQLQMIFLWRTYNHKYSDSQMDFFSKCVPFYWQIPPAFGLNSCKEKNFNEENNKIINWNKHSQCADVDTVKGEVYIIKITHEK